MVTFQAFKLSPMLCMYGQPHLNLNMFKDNLNFIRIVEMQHKQIDTNLPEDNIRKESKTDSKQENIPESTYAGG